MNDLLDMLRLKEVMKHPQPAMPLGEILYSFPNPHSDLQGRKFFECNHESLLKHLEGDDLKNAEAVLYYLRAENSMKVFLTDEITGKTEGTTPKKAHESIALLAIGSEWNVRSALEPLRYKWLDWTRVCYSIDRSDDMTASQKQAERAELTHLSKMDICGREFSPSMFLQTMNYIANSDTRVTLRPYEPEKGKQITQTDLLIYFRVNGSVE